MKTKSTTLMFAAAFFAFGINAAEKANETIASAMSVGGFFTAAKACLAGNDKAQTFIEINNAAKLITDQAKLSPSSKYGNLLIKQATELNNLAFDVRAGKVNEETALDQEFAETHNILATYFQGESKRALSEKAKDKAATAMKTTADHIEATAKWSGQKLSDGAMETVSLLRKTSDSIVGGTEVAIKESESALKKGKKEIKEHGKMLSKKNKEGSKNGNRFSSKFKELFGPSKGQQ